VTTYAAESFGSIALEKPSERALTRMLVAACAMTALAGRLIYLKRSFDHDASMFIYLGKAVCDGLRFGYDITDNKFSTVGLMTSVCWRMFGTSWAGYVILQTVLSLGGALMLARCAARNVGEHARLPTAAGALVYLNFTSAVYGGFQLETLQIFFAILAACGAIEAIRSRSLADAFVVGLAAGCAAMVKPSGLAPLCAFALVLVAMRDHTKLLGAALLGLLIPAATALWYVAATHTLGDMPRIYRQISLYASQTPFAMQDLLRPIVVLVLVSFAIVVRFGIYRRERYQTAGRPDRRIVVFAIIWLILELLGAVLQRRMYTYHFLPVAAPAALLLGILPRRAEPLPLLAGLGPIMALSLYAALNVQPYPNPPSDILPVSAYLRDHATPGDSIWQDPGTRALLETDLQPGSRFESLFIFGNYDTAAVEFTPILLDDFEQRKPKFIILPTDVEARIRFETTQASHLARSPVRAQNYAHAWHEVEDYVRTHYLPQARIGTETVYRRNEW
jgi:hypothetical protein